MASKFNEWVSAARLRTIPLSVSGVLIGSFSSLNDNKFNLYIFLLALLTTISYQVLSNFANDYGDGIKGTDKNRIGPKRAVQSGAIKLKEMKKGIIVTTIFSLFLTVLLVYSAFPDDLVNIFVFISLGALAIFSAIKYTIGSNAYGYLGFGDVFVFLFFGLVSVLGSHFLFTRSFSFSLIYPACTIGLLCSGVLNLNNMRDVANDRVNKKNTIAVMLGPYKSKIYHSILILLAIILMVKFHFLNNIKSALLTILFVLLLLWLILQLFQVYKVSEAKNFDFYLKPLVSSTVLYSLLLSIHYLGIL